METKTNETVNEFFSNLKKAGHGWLKDFLWQRFNGQPVSLNIEERAYNFILANSVIGAATAADKGGSVTTEFFYEGLENPRVIDSYLLNSLAGQALRFRLAAIKAKILQIIGEPKQEQDILIGNFGSGPGRDTTDILSGEYRGFPNIKAVYIDIDARSLERGKIMAANRKIAHRIDFIEGNFLKYRTEKKFDIILMIGIFCPLQPQACEIFLKKILRSRLLKENGFILVSNASPKMLEEDPFTCFLMKWGAGWELVYKDESQLRSVFENAGLEWQECFADDLGFHIVGIGSPREAVAL